MKEGNVRVDAISPAFEGCVPQGNKANPQRARKSSCQKDDAFFLQCCDFIRLKADFRKQ